MQVADLDARLSFVVDSEAEPVDQDRLLARFLLAQVRTIDAGPTSPAEVVLSQPEVEKR